MKIGNSHAIEGSAEVVPKIVEEVKKADEKLVAFVRERPIAAVVTALAVGYLIGRVITRLG